jgi:putative selenium metabolism protein SsnA
MPFRLEPPENFVQILQRVWWRLDRALTRPEIHLSALAGGADALLSGTTTIVDHHASPNAIEESLGDIASALESLGARSVLCYEVTDRDGSERAEAGLEENRRFLKEARPLARGMVGAHASFTLSEDSLAGCVDLARSAGAGIHVHVAEDDADQRDAVARFRTSVVDRLNQAGAVADSSLLAHCVHVHPSEIAVIQESKAAVAHNPRSNMNNAVGRAPALALGNRVALGTDGIDGDMFAESKTAYWRAREAGDDVSPGWALGRLAESARVAGAAFDEPLLGRIEAGAPADLVVLDYRPTTPLTSESFPGHWMFGLSSRHVRHVAVAGEVVVRDRRLTKIDQDAVAAKAALEAGRLWERMDRIEPHPFEPKGG